MKTMTKIFALIAVFGFVSTVSFAADKTGQQDSTDCRQLSGQVVKGENASSSTTAPAADSKANKAD